jgi:Ca2+-binding RTX toxin-like protein
VLGSTDGFAPPVVAAPSTLVAGVNQPIAIGGVSVSEATALSAGQTVTVNLADAHGLLSQTAGQGTVTGNGTTSLTLTGTVAQVNADLATLSFKDGTTPTDTITLTSGDSRTGDGAPAIINVTVNGLPVIAAPANVTVTQSMASPVTGVSLSETGNTTGETFTATLTDTNGLLSQTAGLGTVTGNGTTKLTISGSLSQVNSDLATLEDTDAITPSDTIVVKASDSFANSATTQNIAVTVSSGGPQTFTFTTGVDHFTGGSGANTFIAATKTLSKGDTAVGGGTSDVLELMGGGTFDMRAPTTLTGIPTVTATEGAGTAKPTIFLRSGLNVTLTMANGTGKAGATITGENDSSVINLGSGTDTVNVGSKTETINGGSGVDTFNVNTTTIGATINGGTNAKSVLALTTTGTAVMGSNITNIHIVELKKAATFTANALSGLTIKGSSGNDTITAGGSGQTLTGGGGADTLIGVTGGGDTFSDTYTDLNGVTIENFAAPADDIVITNLPFKGATATFSSGVLTVTNGTKSTAIHLTGTFVTSDFHLAADGAGLKITQTGGSLASAPRAFAQTMASFAPEAAAVTPTGGRDFESRLPLLALPGHGAIA